MLIAEAAVFSLHRGLIVLLFIKCLWLMVSFDTESLQHEPSFWAQLIGEAPQYFRLIITSATATLLFGYRRLWMQLRAAFSERIRYPQVYCLAAHCCALLLFDRITATLMSGQFGS